MSLVLGILFGGFVVTAMFMCVLAIVRSWLLENNIGRRESEWHQPLPPVAMHRELEVTPPRVVGPRYVTAERLDRRQVGR